MLKRTLSLDQADDPEFYRYIVILRWLLLLLFVVQVLTAFLATFHVKVVINIMAFNLEIFIHHLHERTYYARGLFGIQNYLVKNYPSKKWKKLLDDFKAYFKTENPGKKIDHHSKFDHRGFATWLETHNKELYDECQRETANLRAKINRQRKKKKALPKLGVVRALAAANLGFMFYFIFFWTLSRFLCCEFSNEIHVSCLRDSLNGFLAEAADVIMMVNPALCPVEESHIG